MTSGTTKFEKVMHELKPRPAKVTKVEDVTPAYKRITLASDALTDFVSLSPSDHIKFQIDADGAPIRRDYTPRAYGDGELVLEFALHGTGPVTTWARNAEVGSEATILGPRGSKVVHPVFDAYVLIGDETLLPAVGRTLDTLPDGSKVIAVVEVDSAADEIPVETDTNEQIVWAHRNGARPGEALVEALKSVEWPEGDVFVWAGGEATSMRDVRRYVLNDIGLDRENLSISGHWKRGESDFDHHAPIEE